jgi:hypothetical protein
VAGSGVVPCFNLSNPPGNTRSHTSDMQQQLLVGYVSWVLLTTVTVFFCGDILTSCSTADWHDFINIYKE